jgi:hypothetical protein
MAFFLAFCFGIVARPEGRGGRSTAGHQMRSKRRPPPQRQPPCACVCVSTAKLPSPSGFWTTARTLFNTLPLLLPQLAPTLALAVALLVSYMCHTQCWFARWRRQPSPGCA